MSLGILGMGWITPLGKGADAVWKRLLCGEEACATAIAGPVEAKPYFAFRVPNEALADLPVHPRLRRASAISRFAVAAGLAALAEARSTIDDEALERTALIFAVSNGGVTYTKRFYHDIIEKGASAASPLLFPETVFNAPASHLAAVLGLTGASYTLVGDGAVGILALQMAEDLMAAESIDYCLVVGAEEADWILCDAYRKWRLLRAEPPIEPFREPPRGTILSEGAGALLLGRKGAIEITKIHAGGNFFGQKQAGALAIDVLSKLTVDKAAVVITSANGTFVDGAEQGAILRTIPEAIVYAPKPALGESVGASGLWQVISGALAARTRQLPPLLHVAQSGLRTPPTVAKAPAGEVFVLDCGLNQQFAGLGLTVKGR